jgi:signal peptidase II
MKKSVISLIIFLTLGLDRVSKYLVMQYLGQGKVIQVFPGFKLHMALNHGVAFSLFYQTGAKAPWILVILTAILSGAIVFMLWRTPRHAKGQQVALALILSGAISNMLDRASIGAVIDFIDWYVGTYHWPIFNLADSFICIGAFWLVIKGYQEEKGLKNLCSSHKET